MIMKLFSLLWISISRALFLKVLKKKIPGNRKTYQQSSTRTRGWLGDERDPPFYIKFQKLMAVSYYVLSMDKRKVNSLAKVKNKQKVYEMHAKLFLMISHVGMASPTKQNQLQTSTENYYSTFLASNKINN